jgi:uncharacterized Zn-finger protein
MSDPARDRAPPTAPPGGEPLVVELDASELPAFCPNPRMPVWNHHPRVFLDVEHTGQALCPYCSTEYRLKPGAARAAH